MKPMTKSPLQIARAAYQPKLPAALKGNVVLKEGVNTESVADQADIKALFPNTYGMPLITFEAGEKKENPTVGVGVLAQRLAAVFTVAGRGLLGRRLRPVRLALRADAAERPHRRASGVIAVAVVRTGKD